MSLTKAQIKEWTEITDSVKQEKRDYEAAKKNYEKANEYQNKTCFWQGFSLGISTTMFLIWLGERLLEAYLRSISH